MTGGAPEGGSPAPLTFRHRAGWVGLAVLPLLLAGLGMAGAGIWLKVSGKEEGQSAAPYVLFVLGLGITAFSAAVLFGSWDITVDRAAGTVTSRLGLFGMGRVRITPLNQAQRILLAKGTAVSEHARYTRYKVWLDAGVKMVYLTEFTDHAKALEVAQEASRYLGVPADDES